MEFDFIIVGAGSAGCVLANRLSADPGSSVCLIEAGPRDRSPLIHVPIGLAFLFAHETLNWRYQTEPQTHAGNRRIYTPRGKVLGGSSAINGMVYMRGHPSDYDEWAAAGNTGWSFAEVLPYFRRSENNESFPASDYHGAGGELNVTHLRSHNEIAQTFIDAGRRMQLPACDDFNGARPEGVGFRQVTQRNGRRETSATAFLAPVRSRPNLHVMTDALVRQVLFDGRRARGVRIVEGAAERDLRARREVIVSAGAIASPQLLLRSGVGDGESLRGLGVDMAAHLPGVGGNLQDHAAVSVSCRSSTAHSYGISWRALPHLAWSLPEYLLFRRGLLSSNVLEAAAYIRSAPDVSRPDIQFSFTSAPRGKAKAGSPATQIGFGHGYGLTAILLRPKSRGRLWLDSLDPRAAPRIDPQLLSEPEDVETLSRGLSLGRSILRDDAFAIYRGEETAPGRQVQTREEIARYIRNNCGVAFHPAGTCAMGDGALAVVDRELRVHGLEGLRVVDASVMPTLVAGNTNAPTIMIAEKAADMILGRPPPAAHAPPRMERAV